MPRLAAFALCLATPLLAQTVLDGPTVPFEDVGVCPFERCAYGEWTARQAVAVRHERRRGSAVAFRVPRGATVTAVNGVVITLKAGRVQFREPHEMNSRSGRVRVEPGQTLYLLTYQGEGFTKAWFDGRVYDGLDGSDFFNAACDDDPGRCVGRIVEKPRREWWVQLRNAAGLVGWTDQPEAFAQPKIR